MRGHKTILSLLAVIAVFFILPGPQAMGSLAPNTTRLYTIPNQEYGAMAVADGLGNIYVADVYQKQVKVFNSKNKLRKLIKLSSKPTAIAISPDGSLYVARNTKKLTNNVDVFSADGKLLKTLSLGKLPAGIALSSSGSIYITDSFDHKMLVYDKNLVLVASIGGYGTANGKFIAPADVVVDEERSTVYVLDKGKTATESGYANTYVWRVQAFDMNGVYLRSFSQYGHGVDKKVAVASGIAVDNDGRIYISDTSQHIVMVFDGSGNYLGVIYDSAKPIIKPSGVSFRNSKLYAASSFSGNVVIFGVDGFTEMTVSPLQLSFEAQAGFNPSSQDVTIGNNGPGEMAWQAVKDSAWIGLSAGSGTAGGNSSSILGVGVDATGLAEGSYTGRVNITTAGGSESVTVNMTVVAPPVLTVVPNSFDIQVRKTHSEPEASVTVTLTNDLSGALRWNAQSDSEWLTMSPSGGPSGASTVASVKAAHGGLEPGAYTGRITLSAGPAAQAAVTMNLTVLPPAGKIIVETNNEGATFSVEGPAGFSGSGTYYIKEDLPEGEYVITFNPIEGYRTPETQRGTIAGDGTVNFSGTYARLPNIVASMGEDSIGTRIKIFTSLGEYSGVSFDAFPGEAGGASIAVGDVDGDGEDEIVAGKLGDANPSRLRVLKKDGSALENADFLAYQTPQGVYVATGDIDGDGVSEIIAMSGGKGRNASIIRVFKYVEGKMVDTGVNIKASSKTGETVQIAVGDMNGDGISEIGFIAGSSSRAGRDSTATIRALKVNSSLPLGQWTAYDAGLLITLAGMPKIAFGDVDGDGTDEIIVVNAATASTEGRPGKKTSGADAPAGQEKVVVYESSGAKVVSFDIGSVSVTDVAASNINEGSAAEIVIGTAGARGDANISVFGPLGRLIRNLAAFEEGANSIKVTIGELGY